MNDISATTGAASAGTSADASATAAAVGTTAATASDPFAGLQDAESREWVTSKGYKDWNPIVSDARFADKLKTEVSELKAKSLTPPAADAKPEEWDAFYAKVGRPEKAEGYEFALPKDLPEGLPYDGEFANQYKQWAHQAGLTPKQAQLQHDAFVKHQADAYAKSVEAYGQKMASATTELSKAWGEPGSDGFKTNVQHADLFIRNNGGEALMAELKENGLLGADGSVLSPNLAKAMAKAGKAYAEGGFVAGGVPTQRQSLEQRLFPNG